MERTEKRVLTLDRYEHGVVINALRLRSAYELFYGVWHERI